MKLTTIVAARMTSGGYPDATVELESTDVRSLILAISKFLTTNYLGSRMTITIARDIESLRNRTPASADATDMQTELEALLSTLGESATLEDQ